MRRFVEADEAFAERFATNLNKHFGYCIGEEITKLIKCLITELIECFNSYINCQIDEKATESKIANTNYQDLHFAAAIAGKVVYEVDTNQNYHPYCYYSNFNTD